MDLESCEMKRIIKDLVLTALAFLRRDNRPKIVFYHDIGKKNTPMGTPTDVFMKHLEVLGRRSSSYASYGGLKGKRKADVVCFDDGFRGVWEYREKVKSISVKCKVKVFVAPRLVGQEGYLTWDEIRTLNREYGIDFQCHTWSHQTLAGEMIDESPKEERTEEWYKRELVESRLRLEEELNLGERVEGERSEVEVERLREKVVVDELCFPVGNFSDEVIERCKRAGYKKVYASYPGNITDDYIQPRCLVQDLGVMGFKAVLNGGMNPLAKRYRAMHYKK